MNRMESLRERAGRQLHGLGVLNMDYPEHRLEAVDAVLAALGLDDLDAAVERGARRLFWEQHQGCVQWYGDPGDTATSGSVQTRRYARDHARAVLEAALSQTTPPEA